MLLILILYMHNKLYDKQNDINTVDELAHQVGMSNNTNN